jgi:hypothetical protein
MYEISILNKEGVLLKPILNIIAAIINLLSKYPTGTLGPILGSKAP